MFFASPWALLGLLALPVLIWRALRPYRNRQSAIGFSSVAGLSGGVSVRGFLSASVSWLKIAALTFLIIALARPQRPASVDRESSQGIDIMLTMDISGSMLAEDFKPKNRFVVARETLERFALQTENDRLGLVIFAGQAFTQCPLTLDNEMVAELVRGVEQGIIQDGTAIGMAIATSAHRLRNSKAKSRVIILMTDGVNNTGKIDPITAARAAAALGIRIYTVGVGKEGGAPIPIGDGLFGKRYLTNPDGTLQMTEIDEDTLRKVAQITDGKYYRATDATALQSIYNEIRDMEKSKFELKKRRPVVEEFARFLWPGALLLLMCILLEEVLARRTP